MRTFFEEIFSRLRVELSAELLAERVVSVSADLVVASLIFLFFVLLWRVIRSLTQRAMNRAGTDATTASFVHTALKYIVLIIGAVQALTSAGINTAAVLASLGLVGLAVGFAAQDALSNLIAGLLIYWDRPFVIGDLVDVSGQYGRVERITLRSTRVITNDGRMLAVPNSMVINSVVASYTNFPSLRIDIPMTIGVNEDIDEVRDLLLGLLVDDERWLAEPSPRVVVSSVNDYNLEVELQAWLRNERNHNVVRFELRERAYVALARAGIDMPFETLTIDGLTQFAPRHQPALS